MNDLLLTDFDLAILNGDLMIAEVTAQNQQLILLSSPGDWKQSPLVGVGIESFLEDDSPDALLKEIREQLVMDGQTIKQLKILKSGSVGLDASY